MLRRVAKQLLKCKVVSALSSDLPQFFFCGEFFFVLFVFFSGFGVFDFGESFMLGIRHGFLWSLSLKGG